MLAFVLAAGISLAMTPLVRAFADRRGWVSHSVAKSGTAPAMLGGVAVLACVVTSFFLVGRSDVFTDLLPFWVGALLMFSMGLVDDFTPLTPAVKLWTQILVILLFMVLFISSGQGTLSLWTPLCFFWLLGITNALNLLDNMDGLTAGVGAVVALGLAVTLLADKTIAMGDGGAGIRNAEVGTSLWSAAGASPAGLILFALAGGLVGFLVFNFHPARIYLGDSGSHLVGFTLAALPLYALSSHPGYRWHQLLIPPLLLLVPICDTTYVTVSRLRRGVSISQGGKDHLSHRLLQAGFSEAKVAVIFYAAAIVLFVFSGLMLGLVPIAE